MPRSRLSLAALAVVYLVWGSTYLGIKIGLEGFPPFLLATVRFATAGSILYVWALRRTDVARRPTRTQWATAATAGIVLLVGGNGAVTWAEQHIDSSIAALLVASVPLWMALFDRVVSGRRLSRPAVLGLVLGFAGVAVLVGPSTGGGASLVGALAVVLGAAAWAGGSLYARDADLPADGLLSASMQMVAATPVFALLAVTTGELGRLDASAIGWRPVAAVAYLVVFGSILAFSAYSWLLRHVPASTVSTYAYVNPVVAVLLGWAVLAEVPSAWTAVASIVIVASVALIVRAPAVSPGDPGPAAAPGGGTTAERRWRLEARADTR